MRTRKNVSLKPATAQEAGFTEADVCRATNNALDGIRILCEKAKEGDVKAYGKLRDLAERIIHIVGDLGPDRSLVQTRRQSRQSVAPQTVAPPSSGLVSLADAYGELALSMDALFDRADQNNDLFAAATLRELADRAVKGAASLLPCEIC